NKSYPVCKVCSSDAGPFEPFTHTLYHINSPERDKVSLSTARGNLNISLDKVNVEGVLRGIHALRDKYVGCDIVSRILETEKAVCRLQKEIVPILQDLSQLEIFVGHCEGCPND
ncbi:MAG: hypothetical protein NWF07_01995, partial [Candidatus Bathyarchaeota archaeon]|nr:hypothetical protein [Candidatus Bathyarchaeota archaeon]